MAKGDYPSELNIPIPFSLVNNDVSKDRLLIMPAYWFMYNMYALARNAWKYQDRDKRTQKTQHIEFDFLAPDTINEMFDALKLLGKLNVNEKDEAEIDGWENSQRKTIITKVKKSAGVYKEMIQVYACSQILKHIASKKISDFDTLKKNLKAKASREKWINVGGQLIQENDLNLLKKNIKSGKIKSWDEVHYFYQNQGESYEYNKLQHAYSSVLEVLNITHKDFTAQTFGKLLNQMLHTKEWMTKGIYESRAKDYTNPYRKMVYDNNEEMLKVIGKIEDNGFIQEQMYEFESLKRKTQSLIRKWKLK